MHITAKSILMNSVCPSSAAIWILLSYDFVKMLLSPSRSLLLSSYLPYNTQTHANCRQALAWYSYWMYYSTTETHHACPSYPKMFTVTTMGKMVRTYVTNRPEWLNSVTRCICIIKLDYTNLYSGGFKLKQMVYKFTSLRQCRWTTVQQECYIFIDFIFSRTQFTARREPVLSNVNLDCVLHTV